MTIAEYHPWRSTSLEVRFAHLDIAGAWDPDTGVIWLSTELTQAERRSTLTHELVHAERGDEPCGDQVLEARQERAVERLAAQRLIPIELLAAALRWSRDEHELAEELWVDIAMVRTRLAGLTVRERELLDELVRAA